MGIQFVEMTEPARRRLSHCVMEMAVDVNRQKLNEGPGSAAQGSRARTDGSSAPTQPASPSSLGELLVQRGVISAQQLAAATPVGRQHGGQFAATLVRLGFVSEEDLVALVQKEYRLPVIDLATIEPIAEVIRLVPLAIARHYEVLPIGITAAILTIAIADPSNFTALREIKIRTGCELRIVLAPALAIQRAIDRFYDSLAREAG
jgi:type IV pilus assembly protein PilB